MEQSILSPEVWERWCPLPGPLLPPLPPLLETSPPEGWPQRGASESRAKGPPSQGRGHLACESGPKRAEMLLVPEHHPPGLLAGLPANHPWQPAKRSHPDVLV